MSIDPERERQYELADVFNEWIDFWSGRQVQSPKKPTWMSRNNWVKLQRLSQSIVYEAR